MSTKLSFKGTAISLIFCAVLVALLNLYMNIVATYGTSNMQIDLSADGDVLAFHQFDFPGVHNKHATKNNNDNNNFHHKSTQNCLGLCPPPGNLLTQEEYVKSLIRERTKLLPPNTFAVEPPSAVGRFFSNGPLPKNFDYGNYWRETDLLVRPRQLWPATGNFSFMASVVSSAKIIRAAPSSKGTQLKAELTLEGDRRVIWKPRRYSRADSVTGQPTDGPDRHNGEIAAFHLSVLLNLSRVPVVIGKKIKLNDQLQNVADEVLKQTFFTQPNGDLCFYGKCFYCRKEDSVCADDKGFLEGAAILWLPNQYSTLKRMRSPWARTYDRSRLAAWQTQTDFCRTVMANEFFGKSPIFADLIDASIFDYLIGNADRHRVEFFENVEPKMALLIDNGKSFGNPSVDETSILAPLYQCCKVRMKLYQLLLRYSELNLGDMLNNRLKDDPVYPIVTASHLYAVNRRLRKVLSVIASCLDEHGIEHVLIDDKFS